MTKKKRKERTSFLRRHSLTMVTAGFLAVWVGLYEVSDASKHWGIFFGNAIADWGGLLVAILATKYLLEFHSAESRPVQNRKGKGWPGFLYRHSLLIFIALTGAGWVIAYARMDPQGKWGQVVGNIVSNWVEMCGVIFLTKGLVERGSEESR